MFVTFSLFELSVWLVLVFFAGYVISELLNRQEVNRALREDRLRRELQRSQNNADDIFPVKAEDDDLFVSGSSVFRYKNAGWAKER